MATSNKDSGTTRRTLQLTGLSDAVYAEAVVILHQYDVVLDVLVINRTKETLQNLCLELATTGDLKLVERPQNHTFSAGQSTRLRANIKVCFLQYMRTHVYVSQVVFGLNTDRSILECPDVSHCTSYQICHARDVIRCSAWHQSTVDVLVLLCYLCVDCHHATS